MMSISLHSLIKGKCNVQKIEELIATDKSVVGVEGDRGLNGLHLAILEGNYDIVELCTRDHTYIDIPCSDTGKYPKTEKCSGYTPLHFNALQGDERIFQLLVSRGASVNIEATYNNETPLHLAVRKGHVSIVKLLLENNSDVNAISTKHGSVLHIAIASCGENNCVHRLKPEFVNRCLCIACSNTIRKTNEYRNSLIIIRRILRYNCNLNLFNRHLSTALHEATKNNYEEIVECLIRFGADINLTDKTEFTALHYACGHNNRQIVEMLLKRKDCDVNVTHRDYGSALHLAIIKQSPLVAQMLLEYGANINLANPKGDVALHLACLERFPTLVKLLIMYGCDIDIENKMKSTPLHYAIKHFQQEIIAMLLKYSAKLDVANSPNGNTPLHIACKNKYIKIAKLLCKRGSNVNLQNKTSKRRVSEEEAICTSLENVLNLNGSQGNLIVNLDEPDMVEKVNHDTPLHIACKKKSFELVKLLLKFKCNVNIQNAKQHTPLLIAVTNKCASIVELLLQHEADVNLGDNQNQTPLFIACKNRSEFIVQHLLNYNCDVDFKTHEGPALHVTIENKDIHLFKMLLQRGAHIDLKSNVDGNTVLHTACRVGNVEIIEFLLRQDIDVNIRNAANKTPIEIAIESHKFATIMRILDHGCDVDLNTYLTAVNNSNIVVTFINHIVKFEVLSRNNVKIYLKDLVHEAFDFSGYTDIIKYHHLCVNEIDLLQKSFVNGTRMTIYDVLYKDTNNLIRCLDNHGITYQLNAESLQKMLPLNIYIYKDMIMSNYYKASTKKILLNTSREYLFVLFLGLPSLTDVCVDCICSYLSSSDLRSLINVFFKQVIL